MARPVIALAPIYDGERGRYTMSPAYMQAVEACGGLAVMLPLTCEPEVLRQAAEQFDGIILTGGGDVSPLLYGEEKRPLCGEACEPLDTMERILIEEALRLDKPLFGICRGIQILNAVLGGTLYQDLGSEHPSEVTHAQMPPFELPAHPVTLVPGQPLAELTGTEKIDVTSRHHQAIKRIADKLVPMAYSEDGLVEAVYMPSARFVWGVQWHPESSFERDEASRALFRRFLLAAESK